MSNMLCAVNFIAAYEALMVAKKVCSFFKALFEFSQEKYPELRAPL